jgi:hypothetical protein
VAQPHRLIVGVLASQMPSDLLRAPTLGEQLGDQFAKDGVFLDPPPMTTSSALDCPAVRFKRAVLAVAAAVAAQLPRYGRWCPAKLGGDSPDAEARAA